MYVELVPNRNSRPAVLLREGWREGGTVKKRTLANLSHWSAAKVEALRRLLKDQVGDAGETFTIERSRPHGHVAAISAMINRLGFERLIAPRRTRERDLVVAMVIERLIHPASKLATTRLWQTTTLAEELDVADADEDELYGALDWLLGRQAAIEQRLAKRHLAPGEVVLYDVSSSYYEGRRCPLVRFGHNRDGKKGKPIVVYGVMTDRDGRPVALQVYPGNTGDPTTLPDQVAKLRGRFGLEEVVLVGDRGLLTQTQIETLERYPGLGWISALRAPAIRELVDGGVLQLSLFDRQNLAEITSPAYPGERLIACSNPLLAAERARKRADLLEATEQELAKIARAVARRTKTPLGAAEIGQKVGRVIGRFKVAKHFALTIEDGHFAYARHDDAIRREAALDGLYVLRTSAPAERLTAADTVRSYKRLARVERAFRCLKGSDLKVRPIHHRLSQRVEAHILLCFLAYYVEWHLRRALAPLLFADEALDREQAHRDPVAPATPSAAAQRKKTTRHTADGLPIQGFTSLMAELATQGRHQCRLTAAPDAPTVTRLTQPTPLQQRAFELLAAFPGPGHRES
jgi:hypothetical protein